MKKANKNPAYLLVTTFYFFCHSIIVHKCVNAQIPGDYIVSYCSDYEHYNQRSEFQTNLYLLTSSLASRANTTNFYNFTTGDTPDQVFGLFYCDSLGGNQTCQECVANAVGEIQQNCPFSREYMVWYVGCMVRYSNRAIVSINDVSIYYNFMHPPMIYSDLNQTLSSAFTRLINDATTTSNGNSSIKSATDVVDVARDLSLTGYVDCTPDLSTTDCMNCLQTARSRFPFLGAFIGVLLQPSCKLVYILNDTRSFKPGKERHVALGITLAVAGASLVFNVVFVFWKRRKPVVKPTGLDEIESRENLHFDFNAIKSATDNFSPSHKLGRGGFGVVYMGTLSDGQAVAVKRLSIGSGQGIREFKTEASLAAKLQHRNLVKVYGFCLEGDEKLLVYEYVPNKSLDRFLFDAKRGANLKWETRYKIIVGIARGLSYLHDDSRPKIIHRDLKPSNVLLDGEMNPKIADFGMAKLFGSDQTQGNTSRVAGTFGYMSPEYVTTGQFSVKSDIFSYGVILLELVSGLRNGYFDPNAEDHENLLNYAWRLWNAGDHLKLVDSALGNNYSKGEVERCIHVGLLCTQEDPAKRPSIASVLLMLNTQPVTFLLPTSPPAFPYKKEKPIVSLESRGIVVEDVISDLSPR
ncbi:cysteine-rich receptor-like protein kinase 10 [Beta vulgaris subsp. vulgaris]|uniref:cysteine-rich receptor-like protein kinase 10 n=1 Tax=Beta vulgaris subsp. vulgaris TaxID=3555 RepID=UPI002036DEEE|nr:cysteine-rich receptor-like protein kinase 10 [Beta vulgaris subsp. vulgaris]